MHLHFPIDMAYCTEVALQAHPEALPAGRDFRVSDQAIRGEGIPIERGSGVLHDANAD